ncbi:hypothetical protein P3T76_012303 [Phytophthora citrophthora]|uniref:Uncharacterized protein n=1 Tax=Phytophthora citrophthora TaxID=4793 RepID=A0AAD9G5U1_9STRA|nr:hypothetical protein P3T76_012303 [Phytophthora citrophthora]
MHLLVKPPLQEGTIKEEKISIVSEYREIGRLLKASKEVEDVVKSLEDVRNSVEDPMLENSSGTGKSQMAFNLEANGAFEVFYMPCTTSNDSRQRVYEPFKSRQLAFVSCMKNDIDSLDTTNDDRSDDRQLKHLNSSEFEGSVSDFDGTDKKPLSVYAFIIAALSGAGTCIGNAVRQDVAAARDQRIRDKKQPMLFFLDEFPRLREDNRTLVRSILNVFRSLRLPLILSATNGTARKLFTGSDYSRVSRVPW